MTARFPLILLCLTASLWADDRLKTHAPAKALAKEARTEDWTRFLGPRNDAKSQESPIAKSWPEGGPTLLWELSKGEGYATPAMQGEMLVLFHRWQGKESLEGRKAETGELVWEYAYPVDYQDRYGYSNGPRGSPVIAGDAVFSLGIRCMLTCVELKTGKLRWQRNLMEDYGVPQYFFGSGGSPLVLGERVIVNLGGKPETPEGVNVAAFEVGTGKTVWETKNPWGASYASPVAVKIHDKERLLVFAGGESRPPLGGLLLIDPADGRLIDQYPWRAQKFESVNAASPVAVGERVFITEPYRVGGVALDVEREPEKLKEAWKAPKLASHFATPVYHEGYLYGFDGEKPHLAQLVCYDWKTGAEAWREELRWEDKYEGRVRQNGVFRGSLLHLGGRFLCLGEGGALLWLDLSPQGCKVAQRVQLFDAEETWSCPAIHHGLLYICQHGRDFQTQAKPRLLCYDFRGAAE